MSKKDRTNFLLCAHGNGDGTPSGTYCQCPRDCACRWRGGCLHLEKGQKPPVPPLYVACAACGGTGRHRTRFSEAECQRAEGPGER
jgi:hypothetical protein